MPVLNTLHEFNELLRLWEKTESQYVAQIVEAQDAGITCDQMIGYRSAMTECIRDLKNLRKKLTVH